MTVSAENALRSETPVKSATSKKPKKEPSQPGARDVTMLRCIENAWMEFVRTTGNYPFFFTSLLT
jgi:hypothetical protein